MSVPLLTLPWTPAQRGTVRAGACYWCGVEDGLGPHRVGCGVAPAHHRAAAADGTDPWRQISAWVGFDIGHAGATDYGNGGGEVAEGPAREIRRAYFTAHRGRWTTLIVESVFLEPARAVADAEALRAAIGTAHWGDAAWVAAHVGGVVTEASDVSATVMLPWPEPRRVSSPG